MQNWCDEDFDALELVEGALVLNQAINPDTQVAWAQGELTRLLKEAQLALSDEHDPQARFTRFLHLFYHQWGFCGDSEAYFDSRNAFIDQVLKRRKGIPVSLGALLLYIGRKLGFPLHSINFPTQFLLALDWPGEAPIYLNPFNGERVSQHTLQAWLVGQQGPLAKLNPSHLPRVDNPSIIGRWLALIKSALLREEHYTLALRCTNLALTFVPDDPYEIRDRGFIYQQLACHQIAMADYQYFIEHCPHDPASELLKKQVNLLSHGRPVTLH
ncbi:MAG: SirB1 family protein [Vibrio sp.]